MKKRLICLFVMLLSVLAISGRYSEASGSGGYTTNAFEYPILQLDMPIGEFLGANFIIKVTSFSIDSNVTLTVDISDTEFYNECRPYFVNHLIFINASDLGYEGTHTILITATDDILRRNFIEQVVVIDPKIPFFKELVFDQYVVKFDENLRIDWIVEDDNFYKISVDIGGKNIANSYSAISYLVIEPNAWELPVGYTRYFNTVTVTAEDSAGNLAIMVQEIEYYDDRYGGDNVDTIKERNIKIIWSTAVGLGVVFVVSGAFTWLGHWNGEKRKDMSNPKIINVKSERVVQVEVVKEKVVYKHPFDGGFI